MTRSCITYHYWYDLRTDLRKPDSWLDAANMLLRRVRVILLKQRHDDGRTTWKLERWVTFLDRVHEQGRCAYCHATP